MNTNNLFAVNHSNIRLVVINLICYTLYTDVDECSGYNQCDNSAVCNNTFGSYICYCKSGYSGDGRNCTSTYVNGVPACDYLFIAFVYVQTSMNVKIQVAMYRVTRMPIVMTLMAVITVCVEMDFQEMDPTALVCF